MVHDTQDVNSPHLFMHFINHCHLYIFSDFYEIINFLILVCVLFVSPVCTFMSFAAA